MRLHRHGNTTIALPLLSRDLRSGEENDDDGDDDDGTGGEKEVKTAKPFGIFRSFWLSYLSTRRRGNYVHRSGEYEKRDRTFGFDELFSSPMILNAMTMRTMMACIEAEKRRKKFRHSAFMIYHALLTCEGGVKSI